MKFEEGTVPRVDVLTARGGSSEKKKGFEEMLDCGPLMTSQNCWGKVPPEKLEKESGSM